MGLGGLASDGRRHARVTVVVQRKGELGAIGLHDADIALVSDRRVVCAKHEVDLAILREARDRAHTRQVSAHHRQQHQHQHQQRRARHSSHPLRLSSKAVPRSSVRHSQLSPRSVT